MAPLGPMVSATLTCNWWCEEGGLLSGDIRDRVPLGTPGPVAANRAFGPPMRTLGQAVRTALQVAIYIAGFPGR